MKSKEELEAKLTDLEVELEQKKVEKDELDKKLRSSINRHHVCEQMQNERRDDLDAKINVIQKKHKQDYFSKEGWPPTSTDEFKAALEKIAGFDAIYFEQMVPKIRRGRFSHSGDVFEQIYRKISDDFFKTHPTYHKLKLDLHKRWPIRVNISQNREAIEKPLSDLSSKIADLKHQIWWAKRQIEEYDNEDTVKYRNEAKEQAAAEAKAEAEKPPEPTKAQLNRAKTALWDIVEGKRELVL